MQTKQKVIIIGAGVAGLQAAKTLKELQIPYTIFEANSRPYGRVLELKNWADFTVDLGAEFIHGEKSSHFQLANKYKADFFELEDENMYVQNKNELITYEQAEKVEDLKSALDIIDKIEYTEGIIEQDISLDEYLKQFKVSPSSYFFVSSLLSETYGNNDHTKLGIKPMSICGEKWSIGDDEMLFGDTSNAELVQKHFGEQIQDVVLNTPITKIEISKDDQNNESAVAIDNKGNTYEASSVICAVPLKVLKEKVIALPSRISKEKLSAIETLDTGDCFKLFLKFKKVFWPEDALSFIIEGPMPIFWVTSKPKKGTNTHILHVLMSGPDATKLTTAKDQNVETSALNQLKQFFGEKTVEESYDGFYLQDWSKEDYILGGYSYPVLNQGTSREDLAKHDGRLVFAGEHCSQYHFATITGAMETGDAAARYIGKQYFGKE